GGKRLRDPLAQARVTRRITEDHPLAEGSVALVELRADGGNRASRDGAVSVNRESRISKRHRYVVITGENPRLQMLVEIHRIVATHLREQRRRINEKRFIC